MNDRIRCGRIWEPVEGGRRVFEIDDIDDDRVWVRRLGTDNVSMRYYHELFLGIIRDRTDDDAQ